MKYRVSKIVRMDIERFKFYLNLASKFSVHITFGKDYNTLDGCNQVRAILEESSKAGKCLNIQLAEVSRHYKYFLSIGEVCKKCPVTISDLVLLNFDQIDLEIFLHNF